MDFGEYLREIESKPLAPAILNDADALLEEFGAPTHIDRARDKGESFRHALGKDLIELTTMPIRLRTYRLHKQLGLSTFQAILHSSPAEGISTATVVTSSQNKIS